jgi:hypothetical protein
LTNEVVDALGKLATSEVSITKEMITDARKKGVSYVCAHCEHFWAGILKKMDRCVVLSQGKQCGSVFLGMTFPEYKGPLPRHTFPNFCFVCGKEADSGVTADGPEMLGVCEDHLKWVEDTKVMQDKKKIQNQMSKEG